MKFPIQDDRSPEAQAISRFLQESPLFSMLGAKARSQLAATATLLSLRGGDVLYRRDDTADSLYAVVSGRLRAERQGDNGEITVQELGRGEAMGGLSILAEMPHRASIRAVRDSQVLKIPPRTFERLLLRNPDFARNSVRSWLRASLYGEGTRQRDFTSVRTIAIVPAHEGSPVEVVARGLMHSLAVDNTCLRVDGRCIETADGISSCNMPQTESQTVAWLDELERGYRYLVYESDGLDSAWTARCLRQADRIVLVANSGMGATASALTEQLRDTPVRAGVEIVIVGHGWSEPMLWRDLSGAALHHRVYVGDRSSFDRAARLLTGRALGLALGGGGARGFAHVGLMRAMGELGLEPDIIAGTSMGALIGAMVAQGLPPEEMIRVVRSLFVDRNLLNDYTVPTISLIKAKKARRALENLFGQAQIEDLPRVYSCVTTNLTRARAEIHDRGSLAHWVGASMTVPGVAPPIVYNGDLLVDGGVLMSVPSDVVVGLGRGPVIASDVSAMETFHGAAGGADTNPDQLPNSVEVEKRTNIFQILYRTATLSTKEELEKRAARVDCYLRMPLAGVSMFDWDRADELIELGYKQAMEKLPTLIESLVEQG